MDARGMEVILRDADSAEAAREQVEAAREEVEREQRRVQAEIIRQTRAVEARMAREKRELESLRAQAEELMAPIRQQLAALKEGLWTVDLYLGTQEQILTLRDGAPAGREEPIVMRQLVLAMDEECAVAAEEGGIDSINVERGEFDRWLLEDPAHLDQVLPERKGVVALVPRWGQKEYEDPWKTAQVAEANKQTYFLLRNGEQLYRIWTDFKVGRYLLPKREEYANLFWRTSWDWEEREDKREALRPGTSEWADAEKAAEARERHYMRVALIFEGLIHRTTVWHPVPEDVSFLDPYAHRRGLVRFIMDGQDDRLLGTGREPFEDWLRRLNAELRPGMRVIVSSSGARAVGWNLRESPYGYYNPRAHPPRSGEMPPDGQLMTIEERTSGGDLIIRYPRTEEVYDPKMWVPSETRPGWGHRGGYRVPKMRASFRLQPSDTFVLPYDLVTEEECQTYLRARLDRRSYVRMFPVLKSAIAAKRREAEEERPFLEMLSGVLARENGGTVEEAAARLPELVRWWKLANRWHRALKESEVQAVRQIVAEDARRLAERRADPVLAELRFIYEDAMFIGRQRGSGKYVILEPMDDRNVYARRVLYGVRAGATEDTDWWKPEPQVVNRLQVLWKDERWDAWDLGAVVADHLTGPEIEEVVAGILGHFRDRKCPTCAGKGYTETWVGRKRAGGYDKVQKECETCGGRKRLSEEPLSVCHLGPRGERTREQFMAWFENEEAGTRKRRKRRGEFGSYAAYGSPFNWTRRKDGSIDVNLGWRESRSRIAEFKNGRLPAVRSGAVWIDEEGVARLERLEAEARAKRDRENERQAEVRPFAEFIEAQRRERGKAAHVAAFVERFEFPELYEGHMKAHPDERYVHEPLEGLRAALRAALDAGEELRGKVLGQVWPDCPGEAARLPLPPLDVPEADPEPSGELSESLELELAALDGEVLDEDWEAETED